MFYKYPYTNLYNLNLDWLIQAVKELQEIVEPLENVVTSVNGMTGDVTLTRDILTQILGGMVSKFNGRDGDVTLTAEDVNGTLIDITWTSDPGDTIEDLTQTELDALYTSGKRILIFVNNLGVADQVYFLQYYDNHAMPQEYSPTSALAGVASFNGQTGNVTATGADLATSETDSTTIAANLANLENTKVPNTRTVNNQPLSANVSINAANVPSQAITGATDVEMALGNLNNSKVPNARQVNGKSLLNDITLNDEDIPSDVDGKTNVAEVLSYQSQQIGDVPLPTTAQTLTGAIAENHAEKVNKGDLTNINLTGTTNTLQTTIPVGTVFYLNGALNIAIANIASGATFTSSNCNALSDGVLNPVNVQLTPATGITPDAYNHCAMTGNIACLSVSFSYSSTTSGWVEAFTLSPEIGPILDVYFPIISTNTKTVIGIGYVLNGTVWFQLSQATPYKVRGGCTWIIGK